MSFLKPEFEGEIAFDPLPPDFIERIERRVEAGLLVPGHRARAEYRITAKSRDGIAFSAGGFATAYAIGLNEVTILRGGMHGLRYRVSFWRWMRAAALHGALLGVAIAVAYLLLPPMQRSVAESPALFWSFLGFWSLVFPWMLGAVHRRFAERALVNVLRDTLGPAPAETTRAA
jgi:hypothetical protein